MNGPKASTSFLLLPSQGKEPFFPSFFLLLYLSRHLTYYNNPALRPSFVFPVKRYNRVFCTSTSILAPFFLPLRTFSLSKGVAGVQYVRPYWRLQQAGDRAKLLSLSLSPSWKETGVELPLSLPLSVACSVIQVSFSRRSSACQTFPSAACEEEEEDAFGEKLGRRERKEGRTEPHFSATTNPTRKKEREKSFFPVRRRTKYCAP